ncbi:MAG: hypothetical protein ACXVZO_10155 [Gaiellaceae bacterium]
MAAGAASAASQPPSVDVYTEQVPTASGDVVIGHAPGKDVPHSVPLAPRAEQALRRSGKQTRTLRKVASSPQLGAPRHRLPLLHEDAAAAGVGLTSAIGSVVSGGQDREGVVLLVAIVLAPLLLGALAFRDVRRRQAHGESRS